MPLYRGYGVHALGFVHVTLLDRHARTGRRPPQSGLHQLAGTVPAVDSSSARLTALVIDSPVRTGLQRRGQLVCPTKQIYQVLSFLCILSAHIKSFENNYSGL